MPRRIVLISDLQQGSRLEALGDFEWPSDVELDLKTVADDGSNAGLHWLAEPAEADGVRGRPATAASGSRTTPGSRARAFDLLWIDDKGAAIGEPIDVYVPPGESRVVRVPRPPATAPRRSLRLKGDAHAFDNTLYLVDEAKEEATVLFVGDDRARRPAGLLYYLDARLRGHARAGRVKVVAQTPTDAAGARARPRPTPLVVLAAETSAENVRRLRQVRRRTAGRVLDVVAAPGPAETLAALADAPPSTDRGSARRARRDARRDRLRPSALRPARRRRSSTTSPRSISGSIGGSTPTRSATPGSWPGSRTATPRSSRSRSGKGRLVVLASGWNPADSQLARSSKFVPADVGPARTARPASVRRRGAHRSATASRCRPRETDRKAMVVHKPDGTTVSMAAGQHVVRPRPTSRASTRSTRPTARGRSP